MMGRTSNKFPGIKPGSREYIRLQSQERREKPAYILWQKDYHKQNAKTIRTALLKKRSELSSEELELLRERERLSSKKYNQKFPARRMFHRAKDRAKRKGLEFNLDYEDVIIPEFCPVFGFKLTFNEGTVRDDSATLDRIDNTKGYIKGNVIVVSYRANNLKSDSTLSELKRIVEFYDGLS